MNLEETKILMNMVKITQVSTTIKNGHPSALQCPKIMKGQLSPVSLKKISQWQAVDLNLLEGRGSTTLFPKYSINLFGFLQGRISKRKCEYGDSPEKSSW